MSPVTITITSIEQYYLKDEKYEYLRANLHKPLPICCIWWNDDGSIDHVTVAADNNIGVILLFKENKVEGELSNGIELQFG